LAGNHLNFYRFNFDKQTLKVSFNQIRNCGSKQTTTANCNFVIHIEADEKI
jgi:hypothetical protein